MNRFFYILFLCFISFNASAQLKTGLIIAGGVGNVSGVKVNTSDDLMNMIVKSGGNGGADYRFSGALGYKFRIQPKEKPFFYDMDVYVGLKRFDYNYHFMQINDSSQITYYGNSGQGIYYYTSINGSFNYKIIKGLNAGIGLEPTLYYADGGDPNHYRFDIPLTIRAGYNFGFLEMACSYKLGLTNPLKSDEFSSGNLNDLQLQLFIPF